jgi:hypothetical protein
VSDESGSFDIADFAREIDDPSDEVGTRLLLQNERVRVWEIVLSPGRRVPFHRHVHPYFYVCAAPGRVRTRFPNGYFVEGGEEAGGAAFMDHSADKPGIHDLSNVGDTTVRYTTVELL